MKLCDAQSEHRDTELDLRRRVRDRNNAVRGWRSMFQNREISVKKFRNGMQQFQAAALADRRAVEAAGIRLFVALPTES